MPTIQKDITYSKQDKSLSPCIIVDIDGTLAHMRGKRSPYEYDKVCGDEVDESVRNIVNMFRDYTIIVMSGRDEECRELTIKWLEDNQIPFDNIFMRPHGDKRKDSVVKKELYETYIKDQYNILAVFDDRLQVCQMWADEGLPIFRVGHPDNNF